MTAHLNHGVKAKMCETTPFVNSVGAHYVASEAQIEQACDSLRSRGQSITTCIGLSKGLVHPIEESNRTHCEVPTQGRQQHMEHRSVANPTVLRSLIVQNVTNGDQCSRI